MGRNAQTLHESDYHFLERLKRLLMQHIRLPLTLATHLTNFPASRSPLIQQLHSFIPALQFLEPEKCRFVTRYSITERFCLM